jgi:hypothetical protein
MTRNAHREHIESASHPTPDISLRRNDPPLRAIKRLMHRTRTHPNEMIFIGRIERSSDFLPDFTSAFALRASANSLCETHRSSRSKRRRGRSIRACSALVRRKTATILVGSEALALVGRQAAPIVHPGIAVAKMFDAGSPRLCDPAGRRRILRPTGERGCARWAIFRNGGGGEQERRDA